MNLVWNRADIFHLANELCLQFRLYTSYSKPDCFHLANELCLQSPMRRLPTPCTVFTLQTNCACNRVDGLDDGAGTVFTLQTNCACN